MIGTEVLVLHTLESVVNAPEFSVISHERLISRIRLVQSATGVVSGYFAARLVAKPRSSEVPSSPKASEGSIQLIDRRCDARAQGWDHVRL
jgi:hypothetical protein